MKTQKPLPHGRIEARIDAEIPSHYAILVGIADDLPGAMAGISRIHIALRDKSIFPVAQIRHWNDPTATGSRAALQKHLAMLALQSQQRPLEHLLLLFVGHGEDGPGGYRLLFPNARNHESITPANAATEDWLLWDRLLSWLAPIQTKHLLLWIDSCDAGRLLNKESQRWLEQNGKQSQGQRLLWTGSDGPHRTWEQEGVCFFTESLAEGLEGQGGYNTQGLVDTEILFAYARERIQERAMAAGVWQHPGRLSYRDTPQPPLSLTHANAPVILPSTLEHSVSRKRCLLWVGKQLLHRTAGTTFPARHTWPGTEREAWLLAQDQACQPGPHTELLVALGMPIIDAGCDEVLLRSMAQRWPQHQLWIPHQEKPPSQAETAPLVVRLHGRLATPSFAQTSQVFQDRLQSLLDWLSRQDQTWDAILLLGLEEEDALVEAFVGALAAQFPRRVWVGLDASPTHAQVATYQQMGLRLLLASDQALLQHLQQAANQATHAIDPVTKDQPTISLPLTALPQSPHNPYPGLIPFGEGEAHLFFGRNGTSEQQGVTQELRNDVHRHRHVVLYGDSGNGKTSLLHAGLFPALRREGYRIFWTDGEQPLLDLAQQLVQEPHFLQSIEESDALERAGYLAHQTGRPILLCIDQLERALLSAKEPREVRTQREKFRQAIALLETSWPQASWCLLLVIRKDRYSLLRDIDHTPAQPYGTTRKVRELLPLDRKMAQEAMEGPLPPPYRIQEELLERLLTELGQFDPESSHLVYHPPLIQLVCRQLFAHAQAHRDLVLRPHHYDQQKGLQGLLTELLYQETLEPMATPTAQAAKDLLSLLVSAQGLRRLRRWEELQLLLQPTHTIAQLELARDQLTQQRIIRQVSQRGALYLEVAHDLLLDVVRDFHDQDIEIADLMLRELREWKAAQRKSLSPWILEHIQERAGYIDRLAPAHQQELLPFIRHSEQVQRRRQSWRWTMAITAVLLCLVLGWQGWLSFTAYRDAQDWAGISKIELSKHEEQRSILSLAEALKLRPSFVANRRKMSLLLRNLPLATKHWVAHTDGVECVRWSPDGRWLATSSRDHTIAVWDAHTGKRAAHFKGHTNWVTEVRWHPHSRYLASTSRDSTVRIWDLQKQRNAAVLRGHKGPTVSLAWHPQGRWLASGSWDQNIHIWSFAPTTSHSTGHPANRPRHHAVNPSSQTSQTRQPANQPTSKPENRPTSRPTSRPGIQSANQSTSQPTQTGLVRILRGHRWGIWGLSWNPKGGTLVSVSGDQKMILWRTSDWQMLRTSTIKQGWYRYVSWSPTGQYIAYSTAMSWGKGEDAIAIVDAATGHLYRKIAPRIGFIGIFAWHPTELLIASACRDNLLRIWSVTEKRQIYTLRGHRGWVNSVDWSPDGQGLVSSSLDRTAIQWKIPYQRWVRIANTTIVEAYRQPKGQTIALATKTKRIYLWHPHQTPSLQILSGHQREVTSINWSPDGKELVSIGLDNTLMIWDMATKRSRRLTNTPKRRIDFPRWSPNGKWIAVALLPHGIGIWSVASGRMIHHLKGHKQTIKAIQWSPSGHTLASADEENKIILWKFPDARYSRTITGHLDHIEALAWHHNTLASAARDGTIRLWDGTDGKALRTLQGYRGIGQIAWSPDGAYLLAAGLHRSVALWDVKAGSIIYTLRKVVDESISFDWSPHHPWVIIAGHLGWMRLWQPFAPRKPLNGQELRHLARCGIPLQYINATWNATRSLAFHQHHCQQLPAALRRTLSNQHQ